MSGLKTGKAQTDTQVCNMEAENRLSGIGTTRPAMLEFLVAG
jgi:hypothetical protein